MSSKMPGISILTRMIIFVVFLISIVFCIQMIFSGHLTDRESALLSLFIAILSTMASWIITHLYSESQQKAAIDEVQEQHKTSLRTYALKAAEKVNNLSNELNKLSLYLEQELNYTEYHSSEEELQAKEERIESAIHLIRTLKSMNDTSLSDWEGVIGEELDQQREEREEKEEELRAVIDRVESVIEDQRQDVLGTQRNTESLKTEIDILRSDLRAAMLQLSGTTIPKKISRRDEKQTVTGKCPLCGNALEYRQRPNSRSIKSVPCKACGAKLVSRYFDGEGFDIHVRELVSEKFNCPKCGSENHVMVDNFPGSSIVTQCPSCSTSVRLIRTVAGIDIKSFATPPVKAPERELSDDILSLVKSKLPQQPWPVGVHKIVAQELGLPAGFIWRAIDALIRRGDFMPQVSGKLYVPADADKLSASRKDTQK